MLVQFIRLTIVLAIFSSLPLMARAQQKSNPRQIRANNIINGMMERENAESADFSAHLSQLNSFGSPFEIKNLDSTSVSASVLRTIGFLQYLKVCRASSDSLDRAFTDSMFVLESEAPGGKLEKSLSVIRQTFNEDRAAYNNFLETLQDLYTNALDALLFLQHQNYKLTDNKLTFFDKKISKEYSGLMKKVDQSNKALAKANDELKKANEKANKQVKDQSSPDEQ